MPFSFCRSYQYLYLVLQYSVLALRRLDHTTALALPVAVGYSTSTALVCSARKERYEYS
jgi:hypothetical protein